MQRWQQYQNPPEEPLVTGNQKFPILVHSSATNNPLLGPQKQGR